MKLVTMLVFLVASVTGASASASTVMGDWMSPNRSVVHIYPCGEAVCLKISKLSSTAPNKVDAKNPKSELRNRPLCGLNISTDFQQTDTAHLDKGHLYDPESGRTYSGTIVADGDQLNLRGYIGISLLGRTEIWHRVPTETHTCN
jgi:uncharacterized protein (DUF2147 family)